MLVYTSTWGISNLQSSLYPSAGLGVVALSCLCAGSTISCVLAPLWLTKVSYKVTIIIGFGVQSLYVAVNFFPRFYTLVPLSVLLGLTLGPLWTAQASLVTVLASRHAAATSASVAATIASFSGIFFFIYQTSFVWGNLISSLVLGGYLHTPYRNSSACVNSSSTCTDGSRANTSGIPCGAAFCPYSEGSKLVQPPKLLVYVLTASLVAIIVIGLFLVVLLLDNVPSHDSVEQKEASAHNPTWESVKLLCSAKMVPLIPVLGFPGMEDAFMLADFTQAFISCSLGMYVVGYSTICLGVTTSLASMVFSRLASPIRLSI